MLRRMTLPLTALSLSLATGLPVRAAGPGAQVLAPAQLRFHRSQEPTRAALAERHLEGLRAELGLSPAESLKATRSFTNARGEAVVHLEHRYEGHRVLGSRVVAQVPFGGAIQTRTEGLLPAVSVAGQPSLDADRATAIALRHLGAEGGILERPRVEQVVFPATALGGAATAMDPGTGRTVMDRRKLVHARLAEPFVWAYEVRTCRRGGEGGPQELTYYIDARTGAILRINSELRHQAVPMTGTGQSLYGGPVAVPASQMADGTFALFDPTRGTLPNAYLGGFAPDGSGWGPTGLQAWYEAHDADGNPIWSTFLFQANPTNAWGDGMAFTSWGAEGGANGQTAGVDAMVGMAAAWDLFRNALGRDGLDGQGTTVFAEVLKTGTYDRDNAAWSPWYGGLFLGAGSYPANPKGMRALTELDVVAHEMTHGVTSSTAQFVAGAGFEESGLDEATADFFAQMAKAYAARPAGAPDDVIPATGADWKVGVHAGGGTPIRWLDRPSRDHRSADGWYDGVAYMDGHFSAGVLNRALYFLAQGASATPGADDHSVYLPGGMAGIGNDKAARIWFTTVTERLYSGGTGTVTFAEARKQAIEVAKQMYGFGWDCAESKAVENAFGAVNVGRAYGEGPRTTVRFADWRDGDWIERNHFPDTGYGHKQYFPMGVAVRPRVTVENNPNTAVTWSLGGPSVYNNGFVPGELGFVTGGGVINPDGTWTTPMEKGWFAITATSQADPRQFAEGRAFIINMDTDMDSEQDALDLGPIAFSWYLTNGLNPAHSMFNAPWVDDADVAAFVDALKSTWWTK